MDRKQQKELFDGAVKAVTACGEMLKDRKAAAEIDSKGRTDFVTAVDLAVQERLKAELASGEIGFLAEEGDGQYAGRDGILWILDPVDGTTNLIHSFRHSAISLALYENGKPLAGIIYDPFAGELFTATAGGGAFLNGEAISVSGAESLSESLCSVGTNPGVRQGADDAFRRLRAVYERCHDIRRIGAASIEMCYVACGRLEGYAEHGLKPWDYAAGRLIVEEAGGRVTEFDGKPPSIDGASCDILASNGLVHDELLSLM